MKFTKRQIELVEEIQRYAENLSSAAEDLREVSGDDPDLEDLCNLCEHADGDFTEWRLMTKTGKAVAAAIDKRSRADTMRRMDGKKKAANGKVAP